MGRQTKGVIMNNNKLTILYEDNHIIVVVKEPNVPVQKDDSKDIDLLSMVRAYLKEKYHKPGNVYVGLVHRLDRPVGGVMVFAKTSKSASRLSEQIRNQQFKKNYLALVHGKFNQENGTLSDYLLKDETTHMSRIVGESQGKIAILDYLVLDYDDNKDLSLLKINLKTGRHHQIRVQLSHINHPIYGDQKYGHDKVGIQIHLWAFGLTFKHPVKDEIMTFESIPSWGKQNTIN